MFAWGFLPSCLIIKWELGQQMQAKASLQLIRVKLRSHLSAALHLRIRLLSHFSSSPCERHAMLPFLRLHKGCRFIHTARKRICQQENTFGEFQKQNHCCSKRIFYENKDKRNLPEVLTWHLQGVDDICREQYFCHRLHDLTLESSKAAGDVFLQTSGSSTNPLLHFHISSMAAHPMCYISR